VEASLFANFYIGLGTLCGQPFSCIPRSVARLFIPHNGPQDTMARRLDDMAVAAVPALFVVFWSSGFVGGKYGLPYAEPFTILSLRMIAVGVFVALATAPLIFSLLMPVGSRWAWPPT